MISEAPAVHRLAPREEFFDIGRLPSATVKR